MGRIYFNDEQDKESYMRYMYEYTRWRLSRRRRFRIKYRTDAEVIQAYMSNSEKFKIEKYLKKYSKGFRR